MKTVYVDKESFICFMEQDGSRIEIRTDLFDGMSDSEIESYRFVPDGYRWTDPDSGESYTGQHAMPVNHAMGGALRRIYACLGDHDTALYESSAALDDIYAALTELAELIV